MNISPTIFGALFESALNPITRRSGGAHYTSVDNIHKVIDPLFLDELRAEFDRCAGDRRQLLEFQDKIAGLKFFDPACGSGNFLVETYLSLRRLENEVIKELGGDAPIKVTLENFYGIEINGSAVEVARTAMRLAENNMLKSAAHIVEGNALTLDWHSIAPRGIDYIIGNPPFVGHQWRTPAQIADMVHAFADLEKHGKLDYVCAWFNKAADFIRDNQTRASFVATNSICQGESVGILWRHLFDKGVHIDFARRNFRWSSESDKTAAVHCVIIGFSVAPSDRPRIIFDGDQKIIASNINGYLLDAPNVFIQNRGKPLTPALPKMMKGSQPTDGGHLLLTVEERNELIRREPRAAKFIRRFLGAEDFLNGKERYCLWLVDATEDELRLPLIVERLKAVTAARLRSKSLKTRQAAVKPWLFQSIRQPLTNYLIVPRVSSERRPYVPMGFMTPDVIAGDAVTVLPDADLFHFGVLMSSVHMAWMRTVCGRLEISYRYSGTLAYNNFPWCTRSARIEHTAQAILDVRANYPERNLAALYEQKNMPAELRAAHEQNDNAVLDAYDFDRALSEAEIVSRLMLLHQRLLSRTER